MGSTVHMLKSGVNEADKAMLHKYRSVDDKAREIAGLIKNGHRTEAMALREEERKGQPAAVNDALDRKIGVELRSPAIPHKDATGSVSLDRLAQKSTPAMPDTDNLTAQQKFDVYASIIQTSGNSEARDALARGDAVILGMRKENNTTESRGQGVYDDRLAVIRREKNGNVHVDEFNRASTEPTAQYDEHYAGSRNINFRRAEGEDADGDGVRDPGRLAPGTIEMGADKHKNPKSAGTNFALRPTNKAVANGKNGVERDTNHDGRFDGQDKATSHVDLNGSFMIHSGSKTNTDSAGCQTIHPEDYKDFKAAVTAKNGQDRWQYVLTDTAP